VTGPAPRRRRPGSIARRCQDPNTYVELSYISDVMSCTCRPFTLRRCCPTRCASC